MKRSFLSFLFCLTLMAAVGVTACAAPAAKTQDPTERLLAAGQNLHSQVDKNTYPQGEAYKKNLHGAIELAQAANYWQLAVYSSPEQSVLDAADTTRKVVETYFPDFKSAAVLEDMKDVKKWKANPSTATVPPAMLGLELDNLQLTDASILYDMAFMRLGGIAGAEMLRAGLTQQDANSQKIGNVILENTLNTAKKKLTTIPPGYPEKLEKFTANLKEGRLTSPDAVNIQEEELDQWYADLIDMLLKTWSAAQ